MLEGIPQVVSSRKDKIFQFTGSIHDEMERFGKIREENPEKSIKIFVSLDFVNPCLEHLRILQPPSFGLAYESIY